LAQTHAELGIPIDSDTVATRWRGERMDYDLGVWVLCNQANRAAHAESEDGEEYEADQEQEQEYDVSAETLEEHVSASTSE
jgi:hypothetical protein